MLVGFIAVIIILLVIVGLFSSGTLNDKGGAGKYQTDATKALTVVGDLESSVRFYKINGDYSTLTMDYFRDSNFHPELIESGTMASEDWDNWPIGLPDPYTGDYIKLGGPAGDEMRLIVVPIDNGEGASIYLMKKKVNNIDPQYLKILEKTLAKNDKYVGG